MTKICVLEIGARVIDTNNKDYTCFYKDWYEGESETLDLFYDESTFNTNFFLGKNSHLLTESIQHTFYDITSRLNDEHPKEYSDS